MLNKPSLLAGRNLAKSFIRYHSHGGVPGENLPFDISNRYRFTAIFTAWCVLGFGAPFLILRHQLIKK